jgi:hypothetical protein
MNNRLRPNMSVKRPNSNAPTHAPATYSDAAQPAISAAEMLMPLPLAEIAPAIEPTIVTSRPSRIQTVPKPMRIRQCQRDHGSRSSRAGMFVSIVPSCSLGTTAVAIVGSSFDLSLQAQLPRFAPPPTFTRWGSLVAGGIRRSAVLGERLVGNG